MYIHGPLKLQIVISISITCHHILTTLIWSFEETLKDRNQMKVWFLNRGYPKRVIDTEMEKVNSCVHREKEIQK